MKLLLECRTFKNEKMKMLSNLVSEIGDVIDSLTLSSKEKMQLRANLTEVLSRFEADLQREQSSVIRSESQGNWLQRSWRPIVMLVFSSVVLLGIFTPLPLPGSDDISESDPENRNSDDRGNSKASELLQKRGGSESH